MKDKLTELIEQYLYSNKDTFGDSVECLNGSKQDLIQAILDLIVKELDTHFPEEDGVTTNYDIKDIKHKLEGE